MRCLFECMKQKLWHCQGWRVACTNARGLGGVPLRTPKFYSANYTDDVKEVIAIQFFVVVKRKK